jgi:hypothetical protein
MGTQGKGISKGNGCKVETSLAIAHFKAAADFIGQITSTLAMQLKCV